MLNEFHRLKRISTASDTIGKVIEPDLTIVERAWTYDTSLVDCIHYQDFEGHNWNVVADDFILKKSKNRIAEFIKIMHEAKIETERKMRL